jgi:S1-C subfamily serine protease
VKFGKVTRPILGIKFAPDQSVEQLGVSGVLVLDAPATGPAGKAVSLLFILKGRNSFLQELGGVWILSTDHLSVYV